MHEYRKHISDLEGKMVGARQRYVEDPSSIHLLDPSIFMDAGGSGGAGISQGGYQ